MDRADEDTTARFDSKGRQPALQFPRALIVVGDACDAAWLLNILGQEACELYRQRLCLAAARACEDNAMAVGIVGRPLARIPA